MRRLIASLAASLCMAALLAPAAQAEFGLEGLDVTFEDEAGTPTLLAGSHPFALSTTLGVSTVETSLGRVPEGEIRNLSVAQIPGLIGSQNAVPTCSAAEFNERFEGRPACADETAVGYAAAEVEFEVIPPAEAGNFFHVPVYNLDPPPGVAAQLGFVVLNVPVTVDVKVSPTPPYNLVAELKNVPQAILLYRSKLVIWGNPASEAHDSLRGSCLGEIANTTPEPVSEGDCSIDVSEDEQEAFLTLPRSCGGPLATLFSALSWAGEAASGSALTHDEVEPKGIEGCPDLGFDADVKARASTADASSASGLGFGIEVEDEGLTNPAKRAQSDIRKVEVALPEGMVVNPSSANGLGVCTFAQYKEEGPQRSPGQGCPQSSELGTVQVSSPLLSQKLEGDLYIAAQGDNPFGTLFALYMVIRNERYGVFIKQAGRVDPDPLTGRLRSSFEEIPQLPFSDLQVDFREGPRAPLITPDRCGTHTANATLTPWSGGPAIERSSSFEISSGPGGGPCPGGLLPFSPKLSGGTLQSTAGAYSPFFMRLTRSDGEQQITRFDSVLPPGLVGKIAGLGRCPDAAIAAAASRSGRSELASPSCPADSRIGSVKAGAGVGSLLTYVEGSLYLAGPYGGNQLSIVAITPAVAGPFDLGTVAIRESLRLNPETGQVEVDSAASDPIPRILAGVPLQLRDLQISIDRPQFTLNATSCDPEQLRTSLFGSGADLLSSADDAPAQLSERYQASDCRALGYKPKLSLKLLGATKRGTFPSVRSTLIPRAGDANTGRAVVTLPPSEQIENSHINNPCTRVQFNQGACPKASILGKAKAYSPLLDEPLQGPVYFRSNGGERELPDIVADLNGQFHVILVGFIDTNKKGRIRTTFADVPDAPVSRFNLNLYGGKRGLLVHNRNICAHKLRARLKFTGQNNRRYVTKPVLKTSCKAKGRR